MTVGELLKQLKVCDWDKPVYMEISRSQDIPENYEWDSVCFTPNEVEEFDNCVSLIPKFTED